MTAMQLKYQHSSYSQIREKGRVSLSSRLAWRFKEPPCFQDPDRGVPAELAGCPARNVRNMSLLSQRVQRDADETGDKREETKMKPEERIQK